MITFVSYVLILIGAINWFSIGALQYDFVAGLFGTQASMFSRIIYFFIGIAGIWFIIQSFRGKGVIKINDDRFDKKKSKKDVLARENAEAGIEYGNRFTENRQHNNDFTQNSKYGSSLTENRQAYNHLYGQSPERYTENRQVYHSPQNISYEEAQIIDNNYTENRQGQVGYTENRQQMYDKKPHSENFSKHGYKDFNEEDIPLD